MPHRSADSRHWNTSTTSRTTWKLYGSASRRQTRWRQMIRHSALPKPRVSAFKFDLVCSGRLLSILQSLSCCASAWLLIGGLWLLSKGGNAHCFGNYDYLLFLSLFSTHAFRSYISHAWLWWWYEWGGVSESNRDYSGMCDCSSYKSITQTLDLI